MYCTAILTVFSIDLSSRLDQLIKAFVSVGDVLEELCVDFCEHSCLLLCNLILVDLIFNWLYDLFGLSLGRVEVLLTLRLTLENSSHDFFFSWVQSLSVQGPAHAHH